MNADEFKLLKQLVDSVTDISYTLSDMLLILRKER